jgi:hypothetical protein
MDSLRPGNERHGGSGKTQRNGGTAEKRKTKASEERVGASQRHRKEDTKNAGTKPLTC